MVLGNYPESYANVLQSQEVIMAELLESFLAMAKSKEKNLSVEGLMSHNEKIEWEALVKAMDSIDILNVGKDLEKVSKTFKLNRWQQLSVLAYVKLLEMMVKRAHDSGAIEQLKPDMMRDMESSKTTSYDGSMFG